MYASHVNDFCFIVAVASREPPFTARQLIIARLGNLTSLNNSEVCMYIMLGLCDNENSYITIIQLNIRIITITVLYKIHLRMVVSCRMLE